MKFFDRFTKVEIEIDEWVAIGSIVVFSFALAISIIFGGAP